MLGTLVVELNQLASKRRVFNKERRKSIEGDVADRERFKKPIKMVQAMGRGSTNNNPVRPPLL